jgi:hypothetical protein
LIKQAHRAGIGFRPIMSGSRNIALEVVEGILDTAEAVAEHAPFSNEGGVPRFEAVLEFNHRQPTLEVAAFAVDQMQVVQHALHDLAASDRSEERLRRRATGVDKNVAREERIPVG